MLEFNIPKEEQQIPHKKFPEWLELVLECIAKERFLGMFCLGIFSSQLARFTNRFISSFDVSPQGCDRKWIRIYYYFRSLPVILLHF